MRPTLAAYAMAQKWEGFLPVAVKDAFGVWNVGYGEKLGTDDATCRGQTRTPEEADKNMEIKMISNAAELSKMVTVPLSQPQFDALLSFVYNVGVEAVRNSTEFLPTLNAGAYRNAADLLLSWDHVDGVPVEGLLKRREDERSLFLSGTAP